MIRKLSMLTVLVVLVGACSKEFKEVEEEIPLADVTVNSIQFSASSECFPFIYNGNPYLINREGDVYLIDEEQKNTSFKGNVNFWYNNIVGPPHSIVGEVYFATSRDVQKMNFTLTGGVVLYTPPVSLGEIVSFSVINDVAYLCFKGGEIYKSEDGFATSPTYVMSLTGARTIETGGSYYLFSQDSIYSSSDANAWSFLTNASSIAQLAGNSVNPSSAKIAGLVSDGKGNVLLSYKYENSIYTELMNEFLTSTEHKTESATPFLSMTFDNQWMMGESIILDGGTFFNFAYAQYSQNPIYYSHPGYFYQYYGGPISASLDLDETGTRKVIHSDIQGCTNAIKFNNKIYTYSGYRDKIVIVSE